RASASLGLSAETDVSSEDPEIVAAGRAVLDAAAEAAIGLRLEYVGGVIFGALRKYDRPASERGRANSVAAVRDFCAAVGEADIPVGLEVVNRYESNLLNTGSQAVDYISEVGAD